MRREPFNTGSTVSRKKASPLLWKVKEPDDLLDLERENLRKLVGFYDNLQRLSGCLETYGMERLYLPL
jgi:hypothetical protein